jgi:glycosyltransferase involved in cell wall biosynthesis
LRVLLIHTSYSEKGGEDVVVQNEYDILKETEVVKILTFQNLIGLRGGVSFLLMIWNWRVAKRLKEAIKEFRPSIIHIHNWHFAAGPLIIRTAKKLHIPVVVTLHNYRLLCPSATLLNKGKIFSDSLNEAYPWTAIMNKVYRNSYLQTFWLAFVNWFHKIIGTWNLVDRYIILTEFSKRLFLQSSLQLPSDKYVIKSNFIPDNRSVFDQEREEHFLFVGRLSEEKGIRLLLNAAIQTGYSLRVVGSGPLEDLVCAAAKNYPNIVFMGKLNQNEVKNEMSRSTALIFPSIWYETFGLTIIEAFVTSTPVIASNIGSASILIHNRYNGLHFEFNDTMSLVEKMTEWRMMNKNERENYSKNARHTYERLYTPLINKNILMSIYQSVINEKEAFAQSSYKHKSL